MNKVGRLRVSTAVGYLSAARARPNLVIRGGTHVRRVLVEDGRAVGLEVERDDGVVSTIRAKLVVLSAGALQTPPILYRSGIGPRAEVEALGIDLVRDVPGVAQNLCDHPALAVLCRVKDPSILDADQPIVQAILRYTAEGSDQRNDLQIEAFSFSPREGPLNCFAIAAVLEEVCGRGRLRIESADPRARPVAEQRFLEDERDLVRLAGGFRDALRFAQAAAYRDIVAEVLFPDRSRSLTDAALFSMLRRLAASGFHPCGTAKMGPAGDDMAVVDQYGRCHAIEGLAIADASIMPSVPRANTNLTSIMIGEMIGEWVRTRPEIYGL
jgi:choline dehydrogenase